MPVIARRDSGFPLGLDLYLLVLNLGAFYDGWQKCFTNISSGASRVSADHNAKERGSVNFTDAPHSSTGRF